MFSSISSYCSPKKILASYLSKSLAQFFCVDPELVETNLIRDAKVVLNQIEIKERRIGGLLVFGVVDQIEFSWSWDAASLITDVTLTIKGVAIHVDIANEEVIDETKTPEPKPQSDFSKSSEAKEAGEATPPDWKAKYLQQVIDNLTLVVTDVTISIHLNEESKVVLKAKNMELRTLQPINVKNSETSLLQNISLGSIEAWMEVADDPSLTNKYQILEPFGYHAGVQRVSGRRFLDGVLSGLFVQGIKSDDDAHACSTIRVHAGIQQISGLNKLQQVLLSVGSQDTAAMNENSAEKIEGENFHPAVSELKSVFNLPFEAMEVVLDNNTNLRLAECTLRYCTDGTELSVDCTGGIWVDDTPLSNNNRWILDMTSSELVLDSLCSSTAIGADGDEIFYDAQSSSRDLLPNDSETKHLCRLDISLEMFQKLYVGIQAIFPQCEEAMASVEQTLGRQVQHPGSSSTSPWTVRSTGQVIFRFSELSDIWVQVAANSPKLTQGTFGSKSSFLFECKSIKIDSNAGFSIKIPELETKNGVLVIENRVAATFESFNTVTRLQSVCAQVMDIVKYETSSDSRDVVLPIDISLSEIAFCMKEPTLGTIKLSDITGSGMIWKLGLLRVEDLGGMSMEARSLEVTLDANKTTMLAQSISNFSNGNTDYLSAPLVETRLIIEKDKLLIECKDVQIAYPEQAITDLETKPIETSNLSLASLPLSINFTAERLLVKSSDMLMNVEALVVWARPTSEPSLDVTFQSITGSFADRIELACGKFQSSFKFKLTSMAMDYSNSQLAIVPGLGKLFSGEIDINDISDLSVTEVGHLASPVDSLSFTFDETMATMRCDTILFCQSQRDIGCRCFDLTLEPRFARMSTATAESPGADVYFKCEDFRSSENSTTVEIPTLSASGIVQFDELNNIGNLAVGIKKVQLAADFSSSNWSGSLEEKPPTVVELPFAVVSKFELTLKYVGTLVNINDAEIACEEFEGDNQTTLSDVEAHYIQIARGRIPYLLSKADIAGYNVGDSVGIMAGKLLTNTSVIGATVGVASRDVIGSTLTQGKADRGASSSEKYQFGDFTRGVVSSIRSGAQSGTRMRGDDTYQVGDFISGSTRAAGDYASENRVRLAGAGGSAAGMIAGAALLGPVGFVAGSLLGSRAAQSSMTAIAGDPKKEPKDFDDSQRSTASNNPPHQVPDLLSPSNHLVSNNTNNQCSDDYNRNSDISTIAPAITAEAELIGEVATEDRRAVMVQAQLLDPLPSSLPIATNASVSTGHTNITESMTPSMTHPVSAPTSYHSPSPVAPSQNSNQSVQTQSTIGFPSNTYVPIRGEIGERHNTSATSSISHPFGSQNHIIPHGDSIGRGIHSRNTNQRHGHLTQPQPSVQQQNRYTYQPQAQPHGQVAPDLGNNRNSDQQQYRFGDITRGVIARGRQLDSRDENSGYKFGDFTRGLFGS